MNKEELKYCKFCNKEKPLKEFAKSGFAIKNICRECQNKKQKHMYHNSKKVEQLQQENQKYKEVIDKAIEWVYIVQQNKDNKHLEPIICTDELYELLDILKEVE